MEQKDAGASGQIVVSTKNERHESAMADYRALDLTISTNGAVQLSTDKQRRLFAYGYFSEGLAPKHLETWKQVDEGIQMLQGMGAPALSNLEFLYFVNGKMTAMHKLCLGACEGTGEMEKYQATWVDKNNKPVSEENVVGFVAAACVVRVRRKGREEDALGYFTIADAEANNLLNKKGEIWKKNTKDMLWHRASMRALAQHFSDVLQGVRCKEIEELNPVYDNQGRPLQTEDGRHVLQRRLAQHTQAEAAFESLKAKP